MHYNPPELGDLQASFDEAERELAKQASSTKQDCRPDEVRSEHIRLPAALAHTQVGLRSQIAREASHEH